LKETLTFDILTRNLIDSHALLKQLARVR